jgi:hypothetical protein
LKQLLSGNNESLQTLNQSQVESINQLFLLEVQIIMFQIEQGKTGESNKICCRITRNLIGGIRKILKRKLSG